MLKELAQMSYPKLTQLDVVDQLWIPLSSKVICSKLNQSQFRSVQYSTSLTFGLIGA